MRLLLPLVAISTLGALPGCVADPGDDEGEDLDGDGVADGAASTVSADNLNGIWDTKLGTARTRDSILRSWTAVGIELDVEGTTYELVRTANKLTGDGVDLTIEPNAVGQRDDVIEGTVAGTAIRLTRDTEIKDTITLELPRDKPYRLWLAEDLTPAAQLDRESYVVMDADKIKAWMEGTARFKAGSFQRTYLKGATRAEQSANLLAIIDAIDGIEATPRSLISNPKFSSAVRAQLAEPSLAGLALVDFNLYFTTGAGRSLRLPLASDAFAYFITDRPVRAEKLGLVVMNTPTHDPLASTFGRQLLDLGAMPASDDLTYAKAMMELLAKSDPRSAETLSGVGKSALTDWFAVMAIEDYRGTAFGNPELGWGYNLTSAQFYGLLARTLARPAARDSTGTPVRAQVLVGAELRPGDPSYVDVLNGGNDMQEYADMARLKQLATDYLRASHPAVVTEIEAAFAGVIPTAELSAKAKVDIFHFITAQLYDNGGRIATLTGAKADRAVQAVITMIDTLTRHSAAFETYVLAHGITKTNKAAPKATGF